MPLPELQITHAFPHPQKAFGWRETLSPRGRLPVATTMMRKQGESVGLAHLPVGSAATQESRPQPNIPPLSHLPSS